MSLDALRDTVAHTSPSDGGATARRLLDRTVGPTGSRARYRRAIRVVAATADDASVWLPWLVGDVLARTVRTDASPFGDRDAQVDLVARVTARAVYHRWRAVGDLELAGDECFERIVDGVRHVRTDDRGFVERVVRETATLLDEEYPGTAVFDWLGAFERG